MHIPLFWGGIRVSTWAMLIAFASLAIYRHQRRPLFAALVWLAGFEAAWQASMFFAHGEAGPPWLGIPRTAVIVAVCLLAVYVASRRRLTPDGLLLAAVSVLWLVWLATGFHSNGHTLVHLNVAGEVLNEMAKTLWALAYFWPLLHRDARWRWEAVSLWRVSFARIGHR